MFSKERINTGRQLELDIARGFAVLFMIFVHAQIFFANNEVVESSFGTIVDFLGTVPAAPMFMFLLGVGINYTRKNDPKIFFSRGMLLILGGYALNILKGFLPSVINAYLRYDINYLYEGVAELFYVDILQFSGLVMIMFGIFKKYKINKSLIILLVLIISLVNIYMVNITVENFWLTSVTGLFWGSSESSYFPFLTWVFYPIAGYLFGTILIRCSNKKEFYKFTLVISLLLFFVGSYVFNYYMEIPSGLLTEKGYYHHIITDNIIFTAMILIEISILNFIVPILPGLFIKVCSRWSKNVTIIFFIHWIIITWIAIIIPINSISLIGFIILVSVIAITSDYLAELYVKRKSR